MNNKMNFCTLFDSYYLDKGITLAKSLNLSCKDEFNLFIFCFDDNSKKILESENIPGVTLLSHKDLEADYPILLKLKEERSKAEYCWTCTPTTIEYVLNHFDVDSCTYIDADLYFFQNPKILFDEVKENHKGIIITPHRFTNSLKDKRFLRRSGKYCVEFNYFDKSEDARKALTWWRDKCFEWCFHLYEPTRMGDQKYIEQFPKLFNSVHELENLGGGMAPWNLAQYKYDGVIQKSSSGNSDVSSDSSATKNSAPSDSSANDNCAPCDSSIIQIKEKKTGKTFTPVFYHFQDIRYLPGRKVNIKSNSHDKALKFAIYKPYLKAIEETRKTLKDKYNVDFSLKKAYSSNKLIAFLQKNVLLYKIKSLSDIINLDNL